MSTDTWIEQIGGTQDISAAAKGQMVRKFLAPLDGGIEKARSEGFVEGNTTIVDGETYIIDRLRATNYEGAYDLVEVMFVSQQGAGGGGGGGRDGKVHKANDEEWTFECQLQQMTAIEAINKGYISSISVLPSESDPNTFLVGIPIPTLVRKLWMKGIKAQRPLPDSAGSAISEFEPWLLEVGKKLEGTNWLCEDMLARADGFLQLLEFRYAYRRYEPEITYT